METHESDILPFPYQNALTRPLRAASSKRNLDQYLSLWAGQGVRLARRTTAAELVACLRTEITEAARSLASLTTE
jgi:nitronate monooxygenase